MTDLAGPWTELRNEEDWEYDCRIASKRGRLHYCDAFVSDTRITLGHHLSTGGSSDPEKLRDRAAAHKLILEHALAARISHETSEMRHFARELFLLARQCGAAGLAKKRGRCSNWRDRPRELSAVGALTFFFMGRSSASRMASNGAARLPLGPPQGMSTRCRSIRRDERLQWRFESYSFDEQHFIAGGSVA